jgi:hypothetical protein
MKKSTIKYLVILIVIIIIISFTGYNLETEPKTNIKTTIDQEQLKNCIGKNITYELKYVNLTYGKSKVEYVIEYWYIPQIYTTSMSAYVGNIQVYKLNQALNFPLTATAIEIKNITLKLNNLPGLYNKPGTYSWNNKTIEWSLCTAFSSSGNYSIHVSFDIVPVYNVWIYHFNGKEIPYNYNYTLESRPCLYNNTV